MELFVFFLFTLIASCGRVPTKEPYQLMQLAALPYMDGLPQLVKSLEENIERLWLNVAFAKDIKDRVIEETSLDEEIILFCLQYCQGNERKGYLKSVTVNRMVNGNYHVVGKAALQNRHVIRDPFYFVLYDHTVTVNVFGTLNPDNCELRVDDVLIENDFHGIFSAMLRNQSDVIGRVERIPNCRRFLE